MVQILAGGYGLLKADYAVPLRLGEKFDRRCVVRVRVTNLTAAGHKGVAIISFVSFRLLPSLKQSRIAGVTVTVGVAIRVVRQLCPT